MLGVWHNTVIYTMRFFKSHRTSHDGLWPEWPKWKPWLQTPPSHWHCLRSRGLFDTLCCLRTKLTDESCIGRDAFVAMCWMRYQNCRSCWRTPVCAWFPLVSAAFYNWNLMKFVFARYLGWNLGFPHCAFIAWCCRGATQDLTSSFNFLFHYIAVPICLPFCFLSRVHAHFPADYLFPMMTIPWQW